MENSRSEQRSARGWYFYIISTSLSAMASLGSMVMTTSNFALTGWQAKTIICCRVVILSLDDCCYLEVLAMLTCCISYNTSELVYFVLWQ